VEWIAILVATAVILAGVVGIAAALAAGASDRLHERAGAAQSALWAAGFSEREQHLLATMASVARSDLEAASVEVVLAPPGWSGAGIVVTGSRLAPDRLGARVEPGAGVTGRALATGRRALAGAAGGVVVAAIPLAPVPGVVVARAAAPERYLSGAAIARLEALVAQTGHQLAVSPTNAS
jgi:hypothetical protein